MKFSDNTVDILQFHVHCPVVHDISFALEFINDVSLICSLDKTLLETGTTSARMHHKLIEYGIAITPGLAFSRT